MQPLVSVVVPVFNGMSHLPELVASLLAQDYPSLELVFSNGGSTDASGEFLDSLSDSRVRVIHLPTGTTAAENWTAVTLEGRGHYIKLICQDDVLYPTSISDQVLALQTHSDAVMAVGPRDIIDAEGRVLYRKRGCQGLPLGVIDGHTAIDTCYVKGTNVMGEPLAVLFPREALIASLPWDDRDPLLLDLLMYEKVARLGTVVVGRDSIGAFRVSGKSWSTRLARVQRRQFSSWQRNFESSAVPPIPWPRRLRAHVATGVQTSLRRLAYGLLRVRGLLT